MKDLVPEAALDCDEIYRRGGTNVGDEDFALFKCPACARIYLMDYEVDTAYLDPDDLSLRADVFNDSFDCLGCGSRIPDDEPWIGPKARKEFGVTWPELASSRWVWVTGDKRSDDKLTDDLLASNSKFQELVAKSKAGRSKPFNVGSSATQD